MKTTRRRLSYSSEALTAEIHEVPRWAKYSLRISTACQILCSSLNAVFGGIMVIKCEKGLYTGIGLIFGFLLLLAEFVVIFFLCHDKRKTTLVVAVIVLLLSMVLVFHEATFYNCVLNSRTSESAFCHNWRQSTNFCRWVNGKASLKGTKTTTTLTPDQARDVYGTEITTVVASACICFVASLIVTILLVFSAKLGRPVFLNKRRHMRSIVVGQNMNANGANKNKTENSLSSLPNDQEIRLFEMRKAEVVLEYFHEDTENPYRKSKTFKSTINLKDSNIKIPEPLPESRKSYTSNALESVRAAESSRYAKSSKIWQSSKEPKVNIKRVPSPDRLSISPSPSMTSPEKSTKLVDSDWPSPQVSQKLSPKMDSSPNSPLNSSKQSLKDKDVRSTKINSKSNAL